MSLKPDKMNKKERIDRLLDGKPIDRVPFFPFIPGFCAKTVGYPIADMYSDAEKSFDAQMRTHEQYAFDWGPLYGYASYGTWEFGGTVKLPSGDYEQAPAHVVFPVQSEKDVSNLKLPDVKKAGCLPPRLWNFLVCRISLTCPSRLSPEVILLWRGISVRSICCAAGCWKKPDIAHQLLRLATDHIVDVVRYWAETFGAERIIPQMWKASAANYILSPKQFERFVLPYLQESSEKILSVGVKHILYHVCGEQKANLPYWAEVPMGNPGLVSVGEEVDADTAIKYFGDTSILIGNIDGKVILNGPSESLYRLCTETITKLKHAPRGYMMCSACEIPPTSPPYNVYLMRKAIDDVGWYD